MNQLPVLLSIPHGGTQTPPELADRVCITPTALHDDSDAFTREIYNLGDHVAAVVDNPIARAFVDVNRAVDDRPPTNPDGVVKSSTCLLAPIYCDDQPLPDDLIDTLLTRYYHPYHQAIRAALQQSGLQLALDCHSMLATGPAIGPDPGHPRPLICLGNVRGQTAPQALVERLAACLRDAFGVSTADVAINQPFAGGYITRTYGTGTLPWVQVELNRSLYLTEPWFERVSLTIDGARLQWLRHRFHEALVRYFDAP